MTHQRPQVPDINSASPGHLEYNLWRSIDIRLYKRARLVCLPNPCLPKITKNRQTEALPSKGRAELSTLVYGTRFVNYFSRTWLPGLFSRKISQHCTVLQAEHQIVSLQIYVKSGRGFAIWVREGHTSVDGVGFGMQKIKRQ